MEKPNRVRARVVKSERRVSSLLVSNSNQVHKDDFINQYGGEILKPPYNLNELKAIGGYSSILQQCIDAYKTNIVGFGIEADYRIDTNSIEEEKGKLDEARKEYNILGDFIRYLNLDESPEIVLENMLDDREKMGNGYIEILRDLKNDPIGIEYADAQYIRVCKKTEPTEVTYKLTQGDEVVELKRNKRYRKYVQLVNNKKVYFKEYGDPRVMNKENGEFFSDPSELSEELHATELFHFKIGSGTYGEPRWIGNLINLMGARNAEELNYRYFKDGRHLPLAITVSDGRLDDDSFNALKDYADDLGGVENAHKFLLLEVDGSTDKIKIGNDTKENSSKIDLKSLAETLQQDALFLEYDQRSREKLRSSFRLPPLYTGEAQDYNRATASVARTITEEQVFQPERKRLARILNTMFLEPLEMNYTKIRVKGADLHDPVEISEVIQPYVRAGAVAPNDLREVLEMVLGKKLDPFSDEYNIPIQVLLREMGNPLSGLNVEKSEGNKDNEIVNVLKDLRDIIEDLNDE